MVLIGSSGDAMGAPVPAEGAVFVGKGLPDLARIPVDQQGGSHPDLVSAFDQRRAENPLTHHDVSGEVERFVRDHMDEVLPYYALTRGVPFESSAVLAATGLTEADLRMVNPALRVVEHKGAPTLAFQTAKMKEPQIVEHVGSSESYRVEDIYAALYCKENIRRDTRQVAGRTETRFFHRGLNRYLAANDYGMMPYVRDEAGLKTFAEGEPGRLKPFAESVKYELSRIGDNIRYVSEDVALRIPGGENMQDEKARGPVLERMRGMLADERTRDILLSGVTPSLLWRRVNNRMSELMERFRLRSENPRRDFYAFAEKGGDTALRDVFTEPAAGDGEGVNHLRSDMFPEPILVKGTPDARQMAAGLASRIRYRLLRRVLSEEPNLAAIVNPVLERANLLEANELRQSGVTEVIRLYTLGYDFLYHMQFDLTNAKPEQITTLAFKAARMHSTGEWFRLLNDDLLSRGEPMMTSMSIEDELDAISRLGDKAIQLFRVGEPPYIAAPPPGAEPPPYDAPPHTDADFPGIEDKRPF